MWKSVFPAAILLSAISANASFIAVTQCTSSSRTHALKVIQEGNDVVVSLDNTDYVRYQDFVGKDSKKYKQSGRTLNILKIDDISLPEVRESGRAINLVASLMFSRSEFADESDMVHAYAAELVHDLECK